MIRQYLLLLFSMLSLKTQVFSDFSYLKVPVQLYQRIPDHDNAFITINDQQKRQIFYNIMYTQYEKDNIRLFKEFALKSQIQIDCSDENICRFLHSYNFDFKLCLEKIQVYLDWIHDPNVQTVTSRTIQILKAGAIYTFGRDKKHRPVIYFDLTKLNFEQYSLNDYYRATNIVVQTVREYKFVPGVIEKYLWVMDFGGQNFTALNIDKIKEISNKMAIIYSYLLGEMVGINIGKITKTLWNIMKKFVHPNTVKLVTILSEQQLDKFQQFVDREQLFEKYGGIQPDTNVYWPPKNPQDADRNKTMLHSYAQLDQTQSYYSVQNNHNYFVENGLDISMNMNSSCCNHYKNCSIF